MNKPERTTFIQHEKQPEVKGLQYMDAIEKAIAEKKVLRIFYLPFYEDKPYFIEVHPYILKEHASRWYLLALNDFKKQLRTYSLDRIRDVQIDNGREFQEAGFNAAEYFRHSIGIMAPEGPVPLTRLGVQRTQAQYLITRPWHDSQNIEEENEEEIIFSFRVHHTYEFKSLILSLGKDAHILEPPGFKQEMQEELKAMLELYR